MKTLKFLSMLFIALALGFSFTSCGSDDDEPVDTNFANLIPGHWANTDVDDDLYQVTLSINYNGAGTIILEDLANAADDDQYGVIAEGNYTLNGNKLTANYNKVLCKDENWEPYTYHGFSDGIAKTVVYTILACDGKKLVMKDESGNTLNYEKYGDIK